MNNSKTTEPDITLSADEARSIFSALSRADRDIAEFLQVAKYNLRGEIAGGDLIEVPNPPTLIHERGIRSSERVQTAIASAVTILHRKADSAELNLY